IIKFIFIINIYIITLVTFFLCRYFSNCLKLTHSYIISYHEHKYFLKFSNSEAIIMNYLITGGTGFVGQSLINKLIENNHHAYVLTRSPKKHPNEPQVTYISFEHNVSSLPKIHVVINLAGESIFGRWTETKKEKILSSRLKVTEKTIQLIAKMDTTPHVFINASAVGFYGMSNSVIYTEDTNTPANDFLADVVAK